MARGKQSEPITYLAAKRLALRITGLALRDELGVSNGMIGFIERGEARCIDPRLRTHWAEIIGMPVDELFTTDGWAITLPGRSLRFASPSTLPAATERRVVRLIERGWSVRRIMEELDVTGHQVKMARLRAGLRPASLRGVPLTAYTGSQPGVSGRGRGGRG